MAVAFPVEPVFADNVELPSTRTVALRSLVLRQAEVEHQFESGAAGYVALVHHARAVSAAISSARALSSATSGMSWCDRASTTDW